MIPQRVTGGLDAATAARLAAIHAAAFAPTGARGWSADEIQDMAAADGGVLVLAEQGFALGRVLGDEAELLRAPVEPAAQGIGLGLNLVEKITHEMIRIGANSVYLEVCEHNIRALSIYLRIGYLHAGRRKAYYRCGEKAADAIIMVKKSTDCP